MSASPFRYFDDQRLTLQCGSELPAAQSLLTFGDNPTLLMQLTAAPTAEQLLDAAEQAYVAGYEQQASTEFELQGMAIAGIGDPLLQLDLLKQVIPDFKRQRHGVPITLVSYGLVAADKAVALCQQLVDLEVERIEIFLPATNPPAYQQLVQPKQHGFSEVCQFIHTASDAGLYVSCFAYEPVKQQSALRALAKELGARDFVVKPG
ncbi:hydrolase TatD [Alishewanella sp. HL-SH06]|uniref:hydrolase TatD n=1 Tax=Alishewanella sp. HL-SH06 TaxID=3461144 RepID=UPI0040430139